MERLTERAEVNKCPGIWVEEKFANDGLRTWFNGYDEGYSAINKCAEYEDFEEIFRSKMTDAACDFLKDKEEFAKWLDRNKWITKKCDEYARAEEQGGISPGVGKDGGCEMKLIDADKGYEVLDRLFSAIQKNNYAATQQMLDDAWKEWCAISVAYDADKVVEQLELLLENAEHDLNTYEEKAAYNTAYLKAIELVKGGWSK